MPINVDLCGQVSALITAWLEVRVLPGPPRILVLMEISPNPAISPELAGIFARARLCKGVLELSGLFRGLCLCPRNSVSRKQRFQFEEMRFEGAAIGWEGQAFGAGGTIRMAETKLYASRL